MICSHPTNLRLHCFTTFGELTKIASVRLYRETLGLRFEKEDLIPTDQFDASRPKPGTTEIDSNFF